MAKFLKVVRRPHDCSAELETELNDAIVSRDVWLGSVAQCSCGRKFKLRDSQRDGFYWSELAEGEQL